MSQRARCEFRMTVKTGDKEEDGGYGTRTQGVVRRPAIHHQSPCFDKVITGNYLPRVSGALPRATQQVTSGGQSQCTVTPSHQGCL